MMVLHLTVLGGFVARCGCNAASATTCDAIVLCIAANLGPGLRYDTATGLISVRLSTDADQATRFGTDGGIYTPGTGASPDPTTGRKTIAGLPAQIAGGSGSGGGGMTPFSSPYGMEYAVANRLDFVTIHTFSLADGVAHARIAGPDTNIAANTDNPSTITWRNISSVQLPSLNVDGGTRESPTGENSGAPASLLTPYGGWFGFYALQYAPQTLVESLWQLAARAVAQVTVYGGEVEADVEGYLTAAIDAIIQVGAQDWAMCTVPAYVNDSGGNKIQAPLADWVAMVQGAGIVPVVDLFDETDTLTPWSVAAITATGAQWIRILSPQRTNNVITEARIAELVAPGLQLTVVTTARHVDTTAMFAAGARGVISDSPVYARGARGAPGDLDYRKRTVIPGLQSRTAIEGDLTLRSDDGHGNADVGYARQADVGRYFPAQFGWVGGIGTHLTAQLLGELCPIEVATGYRLRLRFRVAPEQASAPPGTQPHLGIFFCAPDDQNITYFDADGDPTTINGYWFNIRVGTTLPGLLTLGKFNNGVHSVILQDQTFSSITIGSWINCTVTVLDADNIQFTISHGAVTETYNIVDSDHRGRYAYYAWEDAYTTPAQNAGFGHGYAPFTTFSTTDPMIELL